ncbi:MAG: 3-deoxy-manno-octulosonate cytidylyltransferase [Deltaproteobacteria bacterium]|nr:3-deoxy-manno-octulosonate cytidylyltransferase [Deltaproteobacteria bacterium]
MGSSRLPGKPLADLGGRALVVRVLERAWAVPGRPDVLVATDHEDVAAAVRAVGGQAVITRPDHPSGTDRVWEAVQGTKADVVVNLQGDEPFVDPALVARVARAVLDPGAEVATAACPLEPTDRDRPSVVKVLVDPEGLALDFSRRFAPGRTNLRHLGVYAFCRAALARFAALVPSPREQAERLEVLRLLEAGEPVRVVSAGFAPLSIDTPEDLVLARRVLSHAPGQVHSDPP